MENCKATSRKSLAASRTELTALPDGLRDRVTVHLAKRELKYAHLSPSGRVIARALNDAADGIPRDAEQDARWRRLGIHPESPVAS